MWLGSYCILDSWLVLVFSCSHFFFPSFSPFSPFSFFPYCLDSVKLLEYLVCKSQNTCSITIAAPSETLPVLWLKSLFYEYTSPDTSSYQPQAKPHGTELSSISPNQSAATGRDTGLGSRMFRLSRATEIVIQSISLYPTSSLILSVCVYLLFLMCYSE